MSKESARQKPKNDSKIKKPAKVSNDFSQGAMEPASTPELLESLPDHPTARPIRHSAILRMQRQRGNTYVQRALEKGQPNSAQGDLSDIQRNPLGALADWARDRIGDWTNTRDDEERLDAQEDLADFMSQDYELLNHHPSTGIGLFNANYKPRTGEMTITVKIAFNMQNGNPADPEWVAAVGGPAEAAKYAPEQFRWQGDEAAEWKRRAISDAQNFWGRRYTFYTTQPYWDSLPPVNVNVRVVEAPATDRDPDKQAHFVVRVRKWPTDTGRGGSVEESITSPGSGSNQGTGRFEEMGGDAGGVGELDVRNFTRTTGTRARYGEADRDNPGQIFFDQGKSDVSAADKASLNKFGETLGKPYMPPFDVTITGHSSSEGGDEMNMRLSEDRARNVSNEVVSGGAKKQPLVRGVGEAGADPTPQWRRVDLVVGQFQASQRTVMHEFGHIFGLDDEYPSSDTGSRTVGTEVGHSQLAQDLIPGQQPVVAHHNENIMSNGEMMQPHHYVTFLEALGQMTDTLGKWDVRPYNFAGERGDFPTPSGDTAIG
ncbi:MAG: OmpA family protein [Chloroflexota bacterium]